MTARSALQGGQPGDDNNQEAVAMPGKNTLPIASSGAGRKVVGLLVLAAVLVLVIKYPSDAATWAKGLTDGAIAAVDGIASFIRQVA